MSTEPNKLIFVDTWAWLALSNRKDTHHELAKKEYNEIKAAFTSFVLMQELKINKVFTGDTHFEKVNLGFKILPK